MGYLRQLAKRLGFTDAVVDTFHPVSAVKLRGWLYQFRLQQCGWATVIHPYVIVQGGEHVRIGAYSALNSFVHIWGHKGVWIGDRVMIASHVSIVSVSHDHSAESMRFAEPIGGPVVIQDDVWIGAQAVIMPGITIGRGAVVGAGAIVREDVPPYAIVAGVPARLIRYRSGNQAVRVESINLENA